MNKKTIQTFFKALDFDESDRPDINVVMSCYAEGSDLRFGNGPILKGKQAIEEGINGLLSMLSGFASVEHKLSRFIVDGDTVAVEGTGILKTPEGQVMENPFVDVFELQEGKITYHRAYADMSGLG